MKKIKILISDISYHYGKKTGDIGAKEFITSALRTGLFDLTKPYNKEVKEGFLVCTQNESTD